MFLDFPSSLPGILNENYHNLDDHIVTEQGFKPVQDVEENFFHSAQRAYNRKMQSLQQVASKFNKCMQIAECPHEYATVRELLL
jgi:hypothetical protein